MCHALLTVVHVHLFVETMYAMELKPVLAAEMTAGTVRKSVEMGFVFHRVKPVQIVLRIAVVVPHRFAETVSASRLKPVQRAPRTVHVAAFVEIKFVRQPPEKTA